MQTIFYERLIHSRTYYHQTPLLIFQSVVKRVVGLQLLSTVEGVFMQQAQSMDNKDKIRQEFEAWATDNGYEPRHLGRGQHSGDYLGHATAIAWEAWQASREALCIELPNPTRSHYLRHNECAIAIQAVEHCREAIESQGVPTK